MKVKAQMSPKKCGYSSLYMSYINKYNIVDYNVSLCLLRLVLVALHRLEFLLEVSMIQRHASRIVSL